MLQRELVQRRRVERALMPEHKAHAADRARLPIRACENSPLAPPLGSERAALFSGPFCRAAVARLRSPHSKAV
jgi:hypothetical protein